MKLDNVAFELFVPKSKMLRGLEIVLLQQGAFFGRVLASLGRDDYGDGYFVVGV
jgi:hypothetical protein